MKRLTSLIFAATAGLGSMTALNVDDFCNVKITAPAGIKDIHPLADGETFAALSDDGKAIELYSYKTASKIGTIFSISGVKGDLKIDSFDGFDISDNGKKVLLWNNTKKIYRHSFTAQYYVYDVLRSTLALVSANGPQRDATMSHDGRMVAFMRDNNVYVTNIDYKSEVRVTSDGKANEIIYGSSDWAYEEEFGMINSFRWSGDDAVLAFMRFDESRVPVYSFDEYKAYDAKSPYGDIYPSSYSYKYPLAGYPNSEVQVLAYNIDNRTIKKMDLPVDSRDYVPSLEFDGEGNTLMAMVLNREQNRLQLYKVNPGSTIAHPVITEISNAWLSPEAYQMVHYYKRSFVIASERTGYRHLYEYDYNGNLLRQLTSGDWNVTDYYGLDAKTGIHYAQTTGLSAVNRNVVSIDGKGKVQMLNGIAGTESASFSRDFNYFVRKYSSITIPPQYSICTAKGKVIKNLELNEAYAAKYSDAPRMELLTVPNAKGDEMNAYIIKPHDFDANKKYPLLMYQYNGPDSQTVVNSWKLDGAYYIADCGYIVACVDGRGTGNRSREWANCVYRNLGQLEVEDQLAGARWFASQPYIDSNRTACFGWSFGGYMTLMEMANPDSKFKCGIAMASVSDWRFYDSIYTERYMGTPQDNEEGYNAASALNRSDKLQGRLLIMSGTNDDNVHFYNTLQYSSKLNEEGKVFDMMVMAGFEHSLRMGNARSRLYSKIVDFLNTNLR
ncbi:MAG: S9 family peptidase [Muribaculaceae bacterium]|nr:S9 family peptidase [Muribaculaceae bacterium]